MKVTAAVADRPAGAVANAGKLTGVTLAKVAAPVRVVRAEAVKVPAVILVVSPTETRLGSVTVEVAEPPMVKFVVTILPPTVIAEAAFVAETAREAG